MSPVEVKKCPIFTTAMMIFPADENANTDCIQELCQWWMENKQCSLSFVHPENPDKSNSG